MLKSFKIEPISLSLEKDIISKIDHKTKPVGALGKLEQIALQVALIQNTLSPKISLPTLLVFAGDHGITAEGVSPYPQDVTWQMVMNFVAGGAAINVFTKQNNWQIEVIDAGVNHDFDVSLPIRNLKIAKGTKNFLHKPAMQESELNLAIENGSNLILEAVAKGSNCVAFGEMGIGNTSSAAIIMHLVTNISLDVCTGRGTGLNDEGLKHKIETLTKAVQKHEIKGGEKILQYFGGYEIAMITGAILQAAECRTLILIDGFIVSAALLIAQEINPSVLDYCIFAHQSDEKGHKAMLEYLHAEPLLNLQMRLGEGTGAAIALPIVQSAINFLNEMATFESAGVSSK